jgi:tRNA dimethylallyltransferase
LGPAADWAFRESVEADVAAFGSQALRDRLMQVDPLLAHKLHLNDHRRMIRALEVARLTGQPLSHWQQQFDLPASRDDCAAVVLKLDRGWLHERINERVETMLSAGLEAEVRRLLEKHSALGQTAKQAVGYREMIDQIESRTSPAETVELIKAHTRQFARRQEIWFRGLQELQGVEVAPTSDFGTIVDQICTIFERSPQTGNQIDAT